MPSLYDDVLPRRRGSTRILSVRLPILITIAGLCEAGLLKSPMSLRTLYSSNRVRSGSTELRSFKLPWRFARLFSGHG